MVNKHISPQDAARILRLLQEDISYLSKTQQGQIKMVAGLLGGVTGKEIASRVGRRASTVSRVGAKLCKEGLCALLDEWEVLVQAARTAAQKPPKIRGPKGIDSISEWIDHESVDAEPVVELARLLVAPGANIAVFAARERKQQVAAESERLGFKSVTATLRQVLRQPVRDDIHWTRSSLFDEKIAGALAILAQAPELFQNCRLNEANIPQFTKLEEDFRTDYDFIILAQGNDADTFLQNWCGRRPNGTLKVGEDKLFRSEKPLDFFKHLNSVLYTLRERWSCPGLVPSFWFLDESVEEWRASEEASPYFYRVIDEESEKCLKHHAVLRHYLAHLGGLFQMNRTMWAKLPWREEFALVTLKSRPRVDTKRRADDSAERFLLVHAIPELGHRLSFRDPAKPEVISKSVRAKIRRLEGTLRFLYSNRKVSTGMWERIRSLVNDEAEPASDDTSTYMPAVLIPRHMVTPPGEFAPERLRGLEKGLQEGIHKKILRVGDKEELCHIFYPKGLVDAMKNAFESNWYGDEIFRIHHCQSGIVKYLQSRYHDEIPLKEMSMVRISIFRPSYWYLDPEKGMRGSDQANAWRWEVLTNLQMHFANEWYEATGVLYTRMPELVASLEQGFKDVLQDCDADFLLLGLSGEDRAKLDDMSEQWAEHVKALIAPLYDVDHSAGRGRVIAAVEPSLRSQAAKRIGELKSCVREALKAFAGTSRRVTRWAVETAQRCSLAGWRPLPLVIESEASLLSKWHKYLNLRLKGGLYYPRRKGGSDYESAAREALNLNSDCVPACEVDEQAWTVELVANLLRHPRDRYLAQDFISEAEGRDIGFWVGVLQEMGQHENGEKIKKLVAKGLEICRPKDATSKSMSQDSKLESIMTLFEKHGRFARAS